MPQMKRQSTRIDRHCSEVYSRASIDSSRKILHRSSRTCSKKISQKPTKRSRHSRQASERARDSPLSTHRTTASKPPRRLAKFHHTSRLCMVTTSKRRLWSIIQGKQTKIMLGWLSSVRVRPPQSWGPKSWPTSCSHSSTKSGRCTAVLSYQTADGPWSTWTQSR